MKSTQRFKKDAPEMLREPKLFLEKKLLKEKAKGASSAAFAVYEA